MPCDGIRTCSASIDEKSRRRDLRKPASRRHCRHGRKKPCPDAVRWARRSESDPFAARKVIHLRADGGLAELTGSAVCWEGCSGWTKFMSFVTRYWCHRERNHQGLRNQL